MTRPKKWPAMTARRPKWNSGEAIRSSRDSYSWEDLVVQPNWSYL